MTAKERKAANDLEARLAMAGHNAMRPQLATASEQHMGRLVVCRCGSCGSWFGNEQTVAVCSRTAIGAVS